MMKKMLLYGMLVTSVFSVSPGVADERVSYGLGAGALYNGLGANVALMNGSDLKYVALGCIGIGYSSNDRVLLDCGVGAGWMRSDILSSNDKHGLGIHVGVTHNTGNTGNDRDGVEVFVGVPYVYFFRAMAAGGWNAGLTPILGKYDGDLKGGLLINLGYQF